MQAGPGVSGGNGPAMTSTFTGTFGALSRAKSQSLTSIELVPLAAGDRRGLSTFCVIFGVVLLVILGGASSGAVLPPPYLPGWLHPLAMALPPGLAAWALQGMAYFHNDGVVSGAIILSSWIVASAVVLLLVDCRSQARNRQVRSS